MPLKIHFRSILILTKIAIIAKGKDVGCVIGSTDPVSERLGGSSGLTVSITAGKEASILMPPPPPPPWKNNPVSEACSFTIKAPVSFDGTSSGTRDPLPVAEIKLLSGE